MLKAERKKHMYIPFPGGESYHQVTQRVEGFLGDISRTMEGEAYPGSPPFGDKMGVSQTALWHRSGSVGGRACRLEGGMAIQSARRLATEGSQ